MTNLMRLGTSPWYYENSTLLIEGESTVLDLQERNLHSYDQTAPSQKFRFQTPETSPALGHAQPSEEPWSSLNTRVDNISSHLHQLLSWQNGSAREQIHAIDAQHDGHLVSRPSGYNGYPSRDFPLSSPATVASISPYGTGLSDQQHGFVDDLSERNPDLYSGMPHTQNDYFDGASTSTYGPEFSLDYVQDLNRPVSRIDRRSGMESNFEPNTFQDNLVPRSNQMLIIREQVPTHHDSRTPVVYGYQPGLRISYRQHLDNYRRYLPYHLRRGTDTRANQASNTMTSLTQPPDTLLRLSPLGDSTVHALRGAGPRKGMVGPVRTTALATRAKGVRKGPLEEDARAHARDTRGEGSCWPCKIQRYKVSFCTPSQGWFEEVTHSYQCDAECGSEKCFRCKRMRGSPWRWGCIRDTLPSYANGLLAGKNDQKRNQLFIYVNVLCSKPLGPTSPTRAHKNFPCSYSRMVVQQHGHSRQMGPWPTNPSYGPRV